VGLVACRFYYLEASPKGSSLKRFPKLSKKKKKLSFIIYHLSKQNGELKWLSSCKWPLTTGFPLFGFIAFVLDCCFSLQDDKFPIYSAYNHESYGDQRIECHNNYFY
jgi:hypothetical protein